MTRDRNVSTHIASLMFGFAAVMFAPASAEAFCRTTTQGVPANFDATIDGCPRGIPLFHARQCFPYRLLTRDSSIIPNAVLSDKLARAFGVWTAPNDRCTPGIMAFELEALPDIEIASYRAGEFGRNLVGVATTWPDRLDGQLALTNVTFSNDTGEILDVDLELNPLVAWSLEKEPKADAFDLQTVLDHEVGHILGFAHTDAAAAVMLPSATPGETRSVEADDELAICTVYPNRQERLGPNGIVPSTPCNLGLGGASGVCGDPEILHGCSASPARSAGGGGAALAALVVLAVSARRGVRRRAPGR
jgi:hypothetical protein